MILVQPSGSQAIVAVVFPRTVPHSAVRARLQGLAQSARWRIASLDMKDVDIRTRSGPGGAKGFGKQTEATAVLQNAPQSRSGGFVLQPYLQSFSDLRRIEILFLVPPAADFQGLRDFDSPPLSVRLVREGGPYRYVVVIRGHSGALPVVPLTQVRVPAPTIPTRPVPTTPSGFDAPALALVLAIAAGTGLMVLLIGLLVQGRQRARRLYGERVRRMSRS